MTGAKPFIKHKGYTLCSRHPSAFPFQPLLTESCLQGEATLASLVASQSSIICAPKLENNKDVKFHVSCVLMQYAPMCASLCLKGRTGAPTTFQLLKPTQGYVVMQKSFITFADIFL
eukprot:1614530-Amphidinium_carterae.1